MAGIIVFSFSASWISCTALALGASTVFACRRPWAAYTLAFAFIGWTLSLADKPGLPPDGAFDDKNRWSGSVTGLDVTSAASRLTVDIAMCDSSTVSPFSCSVLMPVPSDRILPGDIVTFNARLSDPFSAADLPDEISFSPTFRIDGITAQAYVAPDDITVVSSGRSLRRIAFGLRDHIRDLIYGSPLDSPTAWFLAATLIGDDSSLAPDVIQQFRGIGIAHYLALSGFHVGIIALLAAAAFFPMRAWTRFGRMRHLFVIAVIWLYAFICGLSPSIVRAAVLITLFLLARLLQRQSSPYNSLCVAAVVILAFDPRQLFAPGFQLSFCAVLAILIFAPRLNPFSDAASRSHRLMRFITVPIAAMLGTGLVTIVWFHRFPLLFLIPNIIMAILLPAMLTAAVILVIATAAGLRLSWLGCAVDFIYRSMLNLCDSLTAFGNTEITGIFLSPPAIALAAAALVALAFAVTLRRRVCLLLTAVLMALATLVSLFDRPLPDAELFVTRQPTRTDIVIRDRDKAMLITTASDRHRQTVTSQLCRRYADYLARRSCPDSLAIAESDFTLPTVRRRGPYIIFADKTLAIADSSLPLDASVRPDYLLVTRLSGSRPFDIVRAVRPDTVIIARDTPPLRAARLLDSCHSHSIPALHLTDRSFHLTHDN